MNPNLCRVALRPRGPLEVFDLVFRFVRERPWPLLRLAMLVVFPWWLALSGAAWWFEGAWWLLVPALILGPPLQAPFTLGGGRLLFGEDFAAWRVAAEAIRRSATLWLGWAVQGVAWCAVLLIGLATTPAAGAAMIVLGALTAAVVGIFGIFVPETVLLERVGPSRALRRSGRLSASAGLGALAATAGRWFLVGWLALTVESVGQALTGFVLQLGAPFGTLWDGQITPWLLAGVLIAQPLAALYRLLLYVDARTRSEGWDLQVSLRALGLA